MALTIADMHEVLSQGIPLKLQLDTLADAHKMRLRILNVKSRKERLTRDLVGTHDSEGNQLIMIFSMVYDEETKLATFSYNKQKRVPVTARTYEVIACFSQNTLGHPVDDDAVDTRM